MVNIAAAAKRVSTGTSTEKRQTKEDQYKTSKISSIHLIWRLKRDSISQLKFTGIIYPNKLAASVTRRDGRDSVEGIHSRSAHALKCPIGVVGSTIQVGRQQFDAEVANNTLHYAKPLRKEHNHLVFGHLVPE